MSLKLSQAYLDDKASVVGKRFQYAPGRIGKVWDLSVCRQWFLLDREDVQPGEQPRLAVMRNNPELKEITEGK